MSEIRYVLGHSEREIRRLITQSAILRPITERLLRSAGLRPGMRVLDLGSGAGDVSMLAADLVGASGSVVGIDRNAEVLALARQRAQAEGLRNIDFRPVAVEAFFDSEPFDLAIGRYVLLYQADPADLIRKAVSAVRPGGIVAFHEICLHIAGQSCPLVPLFNQTCDWLSEAFRTALPHYDVAGRLIEHFAHAGLPAPALFCEAVVGAGADSPIYAWMTDTLRSMLPQLVQSGAATEETVAIETLEGRLRTAVTAAHSQAIIYPQVCAWIRT